MDQLSQVNFYKMANGKISDDTCAALLTAVDLEHETPDIAMLLPHYDYNRRLLNLLVNKRASGKATNKFAGLFLSDPFLHMPTCLAQLRDLGINGIANFPSSGFYGREFSRQLTEVGFGPGQEIENLAKAKSAGFRTLACINIDITDDEIELLTERLNADIWMVHGGLEATMGAGKRGVAEHINMKKLSKENYLFQPDLESTGLPAGFTGIARASWW